MDKSERYLKDIAKNTADIAKELKKNRKPEVERFPDGRLRLTEKGLKEMRVEE